MTRQEDIAYEFLENDRIWPPGIASPKFLKALVAVLERLPDDDFNDIASIVTFVVEDPRITAVNVPFKRDYTSFRAGFVVKFDTIVVFHTALAYPQAALMGLLAHELAHSLVSKPDYKTDEESADDLVRRWGFDRELEALRAEHKKAEREASASESNTTLNNGIQPTS